MSETPICERMLKKPAFSPSEWIEEFKRLERAANAMRDVLKDWNRDASNPPTVPIIEWVFQLADRTTTALAQFDALKKP